MELTTDPLLIELVVQKVLKNVDVEHDELLSMRFVHSVWDREIVKIISKRLNNMIEVKGQRNQLVGSKVNRDFEALMEYFKTSRHGAFLRKIKICDFGSVEEKLNTALEKQWNNVTVLHIGFYFADVNQTFKAVFEILTERCKSLKSLTLCDSVLVESRIHKTMVNCVPPITASLELIELDIQLSPNVFRANPASSSENVLSFIKNIVCSSPKLQSAHFAEKEIFNAVHHLYQSPELQSKTTKLSLANRSFYDYTPWLDLLASRKFSSLSILNLESIKLDPLFFSALEAVSETLTQLSLAGIQDLHPRRCMFTEVLSKVPRLVSFGWQSDFNETTATCEEFWSRLGKQSFVHRSLRSLIISSGDLCLETRTAYLFKTKSIYKVMPNLENLELKLSRSHVSLESPSYAQKIEIVTDQKCTYLYQLSLIHQLRCLKKLTLYIDFYTYFPDLMIGIKTICESMNLDELHLKNVCKRCDMAAGCKHSHQMVDFNDVRCLIVFTCRDVKKVILENFERFEELSFCQLREFIQSKKLNVKLISDLCWEAKVQHDYDQRNGDISYSEVDRNDCAFLDKLEPYYHQSYWTPAINTAYYLNFFHHENGIQNFFGLP